MESKSPEYLPSLGRLLGFAFAATSRLSERRLRPHDLTLRQWVVLTAVWRRTGIAESELAGYCRMSPSALNRILDRMEEKDLVARYEDPEDGRRSLVHLGAAGKRKKGLLGFYEEINAVLVRGFSKRETEQVADLLERIARNATEALEEDE